MEAELIQNRQMQQNAKSAGKPASWRTGVRRERGCKQAHRSNKHVAVMLTNPMKNKQVCKANNNGLSIGRAPPISLGETQLPKDCATWSIFEIFCWNVTFPLRLRI